MAPVETGFRCGCCSCMSAFPWCSGGCAGVDG